MRRPLALLLGALFATPGAIADMRIGNVVETSALFSPLRFEVEIIADSTQETVGMMAAIQPLQGHASWGTPANQKFSRVERDGKVYLIAESAAPITDRRLELRLAIRDTFGRTDFRDLTLTPAEPKIAWRPTEYRVSEADIQKQEISRKATAVAAALTGSGSANAAERSAAVPSPVVIRSKVVDLPSPIEATLPELEKTGPASSPPPQPTSVVTPPTTTTSGELKVSQSLSFVIEFADGAVTLGPAGRRQVARLAEMSRAMARVQLRGWAGQQDSVKRERMAFDRAFAVRKALNGHQVGTEVARIVEPRLALADLDEKGVGSPRVVATLLDPQQLAQTEER